MVVSILAWQSGGSFIPLTTVAPSSGIEQGKKRSLQKTTCPHEHEEYLSVEPESPVYVCHVRGSPSATLQSPFIVRRVTTSPSTLFSTSHPVLGTTTMTEHKRSRKNKGIENGVGELHLENGNARARLGQEIQEEATNSNESSPRDTPMNSSSQSPSKTDLPINSPSTGSEKHEEVVGGDVTVKLEPGQPPKLARSSSQMILSKPAPLFHHHPSKTEESKNTFQVLEQCSYTSKYIGSTEHGSMDCDCTEEWGKSTLYACGSIYVYIWMLNFQYR